MKTQWSSVNWKNPDWLIAEQNQLSVKHVKKVRRKEKMKTKRWPYNGNGTAALRRFKQLAVRRK